MKTQTIIASTFIALASLAGGSAFADGGDVFRPEPAFVSKVSRAAVQADVLAAQKAGTLRFAGERDLPMAFMGTADRSMVLAGAIESVKHPMYSADKLGS